MTDNKQSCAHIAYYGGRHTMEIVTLEELLESLKENVETELVTRGLATWTIDAAGHDFSDSLNGYSLEDLQQLRGEILEGNKVEVVVDLSDALVAHLDDLIEQAEIEEDDEDDEDDYEEEEDEDSDD